MKYNENNKPLVCMMTNSTCYKQTEKMQIKGILWHSTGANNPYLKRYVQPDDNAANRDELLALLGKNQYNNDWNHIKLQAGVNAFIGKAADSQIYAIQVMPWNYKPWGCGSGAKGSCNNGFIQFEICESALTDITYFKAAYKEAVELTAYLCKLYNLSPFGKSVLNGVNVPVILCHYDSYKLGLGSNHGDIYNWLGKLGKNMDDVRNDIAAVMAENQEVDDMTKEEVVKIVKAELEADKQSRKTNICGSWSEKDRQWSIENGLINGTGNGVYAWPDYLTREQAAALFHRLYNLIKAEE